MCVGGGGGYQDGPQNGSHLLPDFFQILYNCSTFITLMWILSDEWMKPKMAATGTGFLSHFMYAF